MDALRDMKHGVADEFLVAVNLHEINAFGNHSYLEYLLQECTDSKYKRMEEWRKEYLQQKNITTSEELVNSMVNHYENDTWDTEKDRAEKYEKLSPHQAAEEQIKDYHVRTFEEINRDAYLYGELEALTGEATKKE